MRHANIVQFHRAFTFENCTYLILELCPNGSLMEMVKRRKGLTEAEVRFYTIQIAGAIKYMHGKGIIHRDLKMGNIFLDKNMNAKVGDFGLAALLVTGNDMHTIRRTTLCGTPNYIAPEILQKGKAGHDHNVDIWSLGIIMCVKLCLMHDEAGSRGSELTDRVTLGSPCSLQNHHFNPRLRTRFIVARGIGTMIGHSTSRNSSVWR